MKELYLDTTFNNSIQTLTIDETFDRRHKDLMLEISNNYDYEIAYYFTNLGEIKKVIESLQSYVDEKDLPKVEMRLDIEVIEPVIRKPKENFEFITEEIGDKSNVSIRNEENK